MIDRAFKNPKIEFVWDSEVVEIVANEGGVNAIKVKNYKTGDITTRETNGLFMGIGHTPNTKFLDGQITTDMNGFIETTHDVETNIPGVFACGDVQDHYYRQAISAAGTGCMAAIRAERFLSEA
jgi:thioredoxin reductase (NADPH)